MPQQPPLAVPQNFSLDLWEATRARGSAPRFHGAFSDDAEMRREFLRGAWMMGYELVDLDDAGELERLRTAVPRRYPIQPQQLWLVDALNAGGYDEFVVESMRRTAKTTTIFCWLLGRLVSRPNYYATFSAQNGKKGTQRLREWKGRLDRTVPDPEAGVPPWKRGQPSTTARFAARHEALFGDELMPAQPAPATTGRGFRIMMGEVGKGIYFDNGSQLLVLKPDAEDYRGEAGDVSWIDEAQELDPEEGADLFAGIVPLQDTREDSAIVVSGTAGEERRGPFWERIARLRAGDPDIGGADYCAPPSTSFEEYSDEDGAMVLIAAEHPGVGTLTTLDKMRKNWRKLPRPQWAREYLSLWPEDFTQNAVDMKAWRRAALDEFPPFPSHFALGIDVDPNGASAAIAAAWVGADGLTYVELVDHRPSTDWLVDELARLSRKYRAIIGHDTIGAVLVEAEALARKRPAPRRRPMKYSELGAACAAFMKALDTGRLRHSDQAALSAAAAGVVKRPLGDNGWAWGRKASGAAVDITPIVAATIALRTFTQAPQAQSRRIRSSATRKAAA